MPYKPLISVVTIVYNDIKGLEKTYKSVVDQKYENLEYIVIDAASKDGSKEFIQAHNEKFSYWVSEVDAGISDGFNKGINATKGDWIVFLNAGDYFQSQYSISKMIPHLQINRTADIVYGKITEVDASGALGKSFGRPFARKSFERECTIMHPATFHNRAFFESNGLFSLNFKIVMDYEIFLRKKNLLAVFADEDITYMERGGVSQENPSKAYKEMNYAKRMHLEKSSISLFRDYSENILRYQLSKLKQKILKR